jgi:sulfur-oxidizing protein SoxZ
VADTGTVRIRLPSRIARGDVVRVRALVIHPMERIERDAGGAVIDRPYRYIDRVVAVYGGTQVVAFDTTQSVSENPFFAFTVRATDPGPLRITVHDTTGATYEGTADITFS